VLIILENVSVALFYLSVVLACVGHGHNFRAVRLLLESKLQSAQLVTDAASNDLVNVTDSRVAGVALFDVRSNLV